MGIPLRKEMSANAEKNFERIKLKYKSDNGKVVSSIEFGVPTSVILTYAKKNSIDTIIMGSHGATGVKEMFAGSNTEKIVRTSPIPVIARPPGSRASEETCASPSALRRLSGQAIWCKRSPVAVSQMRTLFLSARARARLSGVKATAQSSPNKPPLISRRTISSPVAGPPRGAPLMPWSIQLPAHGPGGRYRLSRQFEFPGVGSHGQMVRPLSEGRRQRSGA